MKTDERQFVFVGNNLAIDFVNTQIIDRGEMIDLLQVPQDLIDWIKAAELPFDNIKNNKQCLSKCLELREALYKVFTAILDSRDVPSGELNTINQCLLNHVTEQVLKKVNGKLELRPTYKNFSIERLLGLIAFEAAILLDSKQLEKLKSCANPKCILLFVDTSKSGKRRWCSMDVCGNRSKVANHYISTKGH